MKIKKRKNQQFFSCSRISLHSSYENNLIGLSLPHHCPGGEIGRHARLRALCSLRACWFESSPGHTFEADRLISFFINHAPALYG